MSLRPKGVTDRAREERSRYGGPQFSQASALPLDAGLGQPRRLASLLAAAVRRPGRLTAFIALLVKTRSETVWLSDAPAGRALRRYFDERFIGVFPQNRLCRGVLLLPQRHSDYLRGRHRQALRTNLRRAASTGIRCEAVSDPRRAMDAALEIMDHRRVLLADADRAGTEEAWLGLFARPGMMLMVARDPADRPLAMTAAMIDDAVCLIQVAVACDHDARWALHDHLVSVLTSRGVRYLLAEGDGPFGALGYTRDVQHYQHLLGYELRHLIPRRNSR